MTGKQKHTNWRVLWIVFREGMGDAGLECLSFIPICLCYLECNWPVDSLICQMIKTDSHITLFHPTDIKQDYAWT